MMVGTRISIEMGKLYCLKLYILTKIHAWKCMKQRKKKYRGTEVMMGVLVAECVWYSNNTTAAVFGH